MLLTLLYFAITVIPFVLSGIVIVYDKFFASLDGRGFFNNANTFENPNPPGCKKPEVTVLWYPRKCYFNAESGYVSANIAKAIINGGTPPYRIRWDNQAFSPLFTPPAGDSYTTNVPISEGWHHVEVIDANNQRAYHQFFLEAEPPPILNLRVRHWCQSQPAASRPGRIQYVGDRYLRHFQNGIDINDQPVFPLQITVRRLYDQPTNSFTPAVLLVNADLATFSEFPFNRGVYEIVIGCYTYLVRITNKCDIIGTVERFSPLCDNCT